MQMQINLDTKIEYLNVKIAVNTKQEEEILEKLKLHECEMKLFELSLQEKLILENALLEKETEMNMEMK